MWRWRRHRPVGHAHAGPHRQRRGGRHDHDQLDERSTVVLSDPGPVKVGQKVAWRNADSVTHTATGSSFDTGSIPPGAASAPITFSAAGNVAYHCSIHPSMVGTLSVTQ